MLFWIISEPVYALFEIPEIVTSARDFALMLKSAVIVPSKLLIPLIITCALSVPTFKFSPNARV